MKFCTLFIFLILFAACGNSLQNQSQEDDFDSHYHSQHYVDLVNARIFLHNKYIKVSIDQMIEGLGTKQDQFIFVKGYKATMERLKAMPLHYQIFQTVSITKTSFGSRTLKNELALIDRKLEPLLQKLTI